jgi:phospholipid/cholesterol/gamma-HCH transport system substrate-binding protein
MENKSHAYAAGAFVLLASALLVALAFWLARDTTVHRVFELSSKEAVTGLQPQAGVRFKGVTVGKVMDIGFDAATRGNILIHISILDNAPITRSTFASLGFQGVTGLAFVQLDDSGESKDLLATSDVAPARIPMRAGLLSKLTDQGADILLQLEETSRRVNQLLEPGNQKALLASIQNIGQAANSIGLAATGINAAATSTGQAAGSLQQFSNNANQVLNAQFGPEKMNLPQLAQDFSSTLKSLQTTATSLTAAADGTKALAAEFQQVSQTLNKSGGPLEKLGDGAQALSTLGQSLNSGTLPRLNRTTDEATRAARQLSRAATAITDNPQALLYGNGNTPPGPGEAGFTAPATRP